MAQVVAAFGSSHSTMLVSSVEHWQEMFDRVDRRAPINDFDGVPRTFDELLKTCRRMPRQKSRRVRRPSGTGRPWTPWTGSSAISTHPASMSW